MRSLSALRLPLCSLLTAWPFVASAAELVLVSPAAAERLLERGAEVTSEFQQLIEEEAGDSDTENLAALADTSSPDWRLYYRDRQLMFAVPSRRNLTAAQKKGGEQEAAMLAAQMLQQDFKQVLKLEKAVLAPESVRVVFIEPAAHQIAAGAWGGGGSAFGSYGYGGCGAAGFHAGFAGAPLPLAPAGFWPVSGGGYQGGCGCR